MLGFSFVPLINLTVAWINRLTIHTKKNAFVYAKAFGSGAYTLVVIVAVALFNAFGYNIITWLGISSLIITLALALTMEDVPVVKKEKQNIRLSIKSLFTNKTYILFITVMFFYFISLTLISTFQQMQILNIGGTDTSLGLYMAVGATSEVLVYFICKRVALILNMKKILFGMLNTAY